MASLTGSKATAVNSKQQETAVISATGPVASDDATIDSLEASVNAAETRGERGDMIRGLKSLLAAYEHRIRSSLTNAATTPPAAATAVTNSTLPAAPSSTPITVAVTAPPSA